MCDAFAALSPRELCRLIEPFSVYAGDTDVRKLDRDEARELIAGYALIRGATVPTPQTVAELVGVLAMLEAHEEAAELEGFAGHLSEWLAELCDIAFAGVARQ
jgi:hypothetical protein